MAVDGVAISYAARVTTPAAFPNFPGKHAEAAMFAPADFVAYLRVSAHLATTTRPAAWCSAISDLCSI